MGVWGVPAKEFDDQMGSEASDMRPIDFLGTTLIRQAPTRAGCKSAGKQSSHQRFA